MKKTKLKNKLIKKVYYGDKLIGEHPFDTRSKKNNFLLVLTKEHLNDEIKMHNRTLKGKHSSIICEELLKLRATKVADFYENLHDLVKKDEQKGFVEKVLWKFQFISLASYDYRVKL